MLATTAAMIEQFNKNNILILEEMGYEVHVAGNWLEGNPISEERLEEFKTWITTHGGKYFHISSVRNPGAVRANVEAYKKVVNLIREHQYEFVHCHTPIGSVIGRIAAHYTHTKIIYTAHGFHFFKGAPLKNWLLYYPVERFLSRWTDMLITINKEDYERAKRSFHAKRTEYIPGVGVDTKKFSCGLIDREEKRKSLGLEENDIMLLSVGELSPRKNHRIVIEAIAQLKEERYKYFICGKGSLIEKYQSMIQELGLEKQVFLLGYRDDISELCQVADLYIFPSYQEGLPVALMEAVACHVPVICTNVRGNTDLIKNQECMFEPYDREGLIQCIQKAVKKSPSEQENGTGRISEEFRKMAEENYQNLLNYDLKSVMEQIKNLYRNETDVSAWGGVRRMHYRQQLRKELGIPMDAKVLLSVGELNENKNHRVVIEAMAQLKKENIYYVICGQGQLKDELNSLIQKLELENIILAGYRADIDRFYQMADVFIFPSLREGLGLAAIEAMASGLPLITSNIHGINDYSVEGITGFKCDRKDVAQYANAIKRIFEDNLFIEKTKKNNIQIAQIYDMKFINQEMEKLYFS